MEEFLALSKMKIEKIEIFVIGPEDKHYTWSKDINIVGEVVVWNATYFDYDKYVEYNLRE